MSDLDKLMACSSEQSQKQEFTFNQNALVLQSQLNEQTDRL